MTIALPARAKLNLDLEVVRRRPDGYHDIRTTVQAIELHDLLLIARADETALTLSGLSVGNNDNSVLKAHAAVEHAAGRKLPAAFHLHKRIPPGSGLGGASSDAAAALTALVAIYGLDTELGRLAAQIGSDVPFFLTGGAALVEGIGEKVTPIPSEDAWFAVAWPGIVLSTMAVYAAYDETGGDGPNHLRGAAAKVDPALDEFARRLGDGWQMTGSGSAFFCKCSDRDAAMRAVEKLQCWTVVTPAVGAWR